MRLLPLLITVGCYTPPNLDTTPWETPILSQGEFSPCATARVERVACIIDGDTFDTFSCGSDDEARIRMLGLQAPEVEKPGEEAQCYADASTRELSRILLDRTVTLTFDAECEGVFGRTLAYVWMPADEVEPLLDARTFEDLTESSTFDEDDAEPLILLNEYMLLAGFSRRYDEDWVDPLRWEPEFIEAETLAQNRRAGLWSICE